jgi:hypothetical protein
VKGQQQETKNTTKTGCHYTPCACHWSQFYLGNRRQKGEGLDVTAQVLAPLRLTGAFQPRPWLTIPWGFRVSSPCTVRVS